jgi:ASC-1-like (ASCH) protein/ribosomal protein S18 acetylase RimI-like enzyme
MCHYSFRLRKDPSNLSNQENCTMKTKRVEIREALEKDSDWVENLMHEALKPFYGGDHRAHARRIFQTHIAGGQDQIGFFSFEQKMFIAEVNGVRAGMIHLVGKRQQTYKISPLIITPEFRGRFGIGGRLLKYAETYVRSHKARQIYCTVAEKNIAAMQFFMRKGFIKAGYSDSHYKSGITETMLYKSLYGVKKNASFDRVNVSVVPFTDRYAEQVSQLLLRELPKSFKGISDRWITSLFDGYRRRDSADINTKYKLIYVALDNNNNVIGVVAATPKKGNPIKIMPFVATNQVAFNAMLIDLPYQLATYGHKLYIHLSPTADEVMSLQRLGWKLDALMPSAYRPGIVTQQWSLNVGESTMRNMRVKPRFLNQILSGKKTLEVRIGYDTINKIQKGERINLENHIDSRVVQVRDIRRYKTFEEMLAVEPYNRIVPDSKSAQDVLFLLRQIYKPEKEKLGVVVLELSLGK